MLEIVIGYGQQQEGLGIKNKWKNKGRMSNVILGHRAH